MTHTPGPWGIEEGHIQRDSGGIRYWQITDGQDAIACNQFCYAGHIEGTNSANARLIAAAPDLLEALNEVVNTTLQAFPSLAHQPAFIRATAAIAKAKGQ